MSMPKSATVVLGHIHFDLPRMDNYVSEFLITQDSADLVFRNKYIKIECTANNRTFLGRVVEGPFFIPEEVDRGSAFAQTSILKGDKFPVVPNYYALARVELLGELRDGKLFATNTRPIPKAPVIELAPEEVQKLIGLKGSMLLGRLVGYEEVRVFFDSEDKKVLPRNIGIFGTVGSGKTNTAQVIIEEASAADYAVIVVDIEGEYINMDKPTAELHDKLKQFGLKPEGLKDFWVYYPAAGECARAKAIPFDIEFSSMDPYVLAEILNFTEAQERVFLGDLMPKLVAEKEKKKRKEGEEESEALRFLMGVPAETAEGKFTIVDAIRMIFEELIPEQKGGERVSSYTLAKKLAKLRRSRIFDQPDVAELQISQLLKRGRVSIIDVSGCDEEVKNIVIAWLLRKVFDAKISEPERTPKTLILIEEAHTFVSREKRERMGATLDMIRTIARRGRKRWLCLGFISQQPSHLPGEIFELCNTRIIHSIKSERNIEVLKATGGDIKQEVWNMVSGLGIGQAIISSPQYDHPIQVDIRPAKSRRELVT
jgi:DNA helicase HerA-like ATPase